METIKVGCSVTQAIKFFLAANVSDPHGVYYLDVLDAQAGCGQYRQCVRCFEYVSDWIDHHRITAFTEIVYT